MTADTGVPDDPDRVRNRGGGHRLAAPEGRRGEDGPAIGAEAPAAPGPPALPCRRPPGSTTAPEFGSAGDVATRTVTAVGSPFPAVQRRPGHRREDGAVLSVDSDYSRQPLTRHTTTLNGRSRRPRARAGLWLGSSTMPLGGHGLTATS